MLEIIALRQIITFRHLFDAAAAPTDLQRFMGVLRWFIGTIRQETFEKKPFNPVLGENHICWVEHSDKSVTEFIGEQVSHHPPVSGMTFVVFCSVGRFNVPVVAAYHAFNSGCGVRLDGTISFGVRFGSNQVSVTTAGAQFVTMEKTGEVYEFAPKCIPDMIVRNVVIGKKYIMWDGEITMSCPSTGFVLPAPSAMFLLLILVSRYTATMKFSEKSKENLFKCTVSHIDKQEPVYEVSGVCGSAIHFQEPLQPNTKQLLIDVSQELADPIHFLPREHQDSLASVQCWRKVYQAIIDNDMPTADREKKIVEQDQRDRSKLREQQGTLDRGLYFAKSSDGLWEYSASQSVLNYLKNPNEYQWGRSTGPGAAPPTAAAAAAAAQPSSSSTTATAAAASNGAVNTTSPRKKDKEKDDSGSAEKRSKLRSTTDDELALPSSSTKKLIVPAAEALQHCHSDSEAQNVHSDEDEQHTTNSGSAAAVVTAADGTPVVAVTVNGTETADSIAARRLSVNIPQGSSTGSFAPPSPSVVPLPGALSGTGSMRSSSGHMSSRELRQEKKKVREEQKSVYAKVKQEKKRNSEMFTSATSLSTIMAGWVKMRNSLKKWQPRWIVLQPGRLIYFRSPAEVDKDTCSGILTLAGCEVRKRPSKKDGFCFKIFHLAQYPIYAKQGLKGETLKKALLPVGADYCIMRVNDENDQKRFIDAIRQAIPDYDRVKQLSAVPGVMDNSDSDSDDTDEEEDDEPLPPSEYDNTSALVGAVSSSTLTVPTQSSSSSSVPTAIDPATGQPVVALTGSGGSTSSAPVSAVSTPNTKPRVPREAALEIKDLVKQMGQLYTKQRRLGSNQKQFNAAFEEFKKTQMDRLAALEKTILFQLKQLAQQQQQRAAQAEKDAKENSGIAAIGKRLKGDPILAINLFVSLCIVYFILFVARR